MRNLDPDFDSERERGVGAIAWIFGIVILGVVALIIAAAIYL